MTLIAHLSDLHLLETDHQTRARGERLKLSFLSFGRPLDAEARRARVRAALWAYRCSEAEHLVITGDLTEDGTSAQFGVLAEVLLESGIDPSEITLVPGNHDGYRSRTAFATALEGPLAAFRKTSAPEALTVLDALAITPVWTVIDQPVTRSAGEIPRDHLARVQALSSTLKGSGRAIAIAQHHQPWSHALPAFNWIDGLQNHASAMALLAHDTTLHVLHGHRHQLLDRGVDGSGRVRVFGATACVEHDSPLRLYEAAEGQLWPVIAPRQPLQPRAARVSSELNASFAS